MLTFKTCFLILTFFPDGEVYYANHNIRATQWTHPRTGRKKRVAGSLPFGWDRKILPDGKVIYVDHENEKTTYTDPRLAFALETTDDGQSFSKTDFRQRFDARYDDSPPNDVLERVARSKKEKAKIGHK